MNVKPWLSIFLFCFLVMGAASPSQAKVKSSRFSYQEQSYLIGLMKQQGFQDAFLKKVFRDKRLKKIPAVTRKNVINKENKRNYENFYSPYSISLAHRFSKRWRTVLGRASRKFQVDQEVLVAILLIETSFGNILGRHPVIAVFSSILVENQQKNHSSFKPKKLSELEVYRLQRLQKKADWAAVELVALLKILQKSGDTSKQLKGSYAGAFGIPQFLPSSYLKWGYDSDNNGSVNLFWFPDAIYSTANYLKAHGWKKGLHLESNRDVIWDYNHSQTYVDTVLTVAKKVAQISKRKSKARRKYVAAGILEY